MPFKILKNEGDAEKRLWCILFKPTYNILYVECTKELEN